MFFSPTLTTCLNELCHTETTASQGEAETPPPPPPPPFLDALQWRIPCFLCLFTQTQVQTPMFTTILLCTDLKFLHIRGETVDNLSCLSLIKEGHVLTHDCRRKEMRMQKRRERRRVGHWKRGSVSTHTHTHTHTHTLHTLHTRQSGEDRQPLDKEGHRVLIRLQCIATQEVVKECAQHGSVGPHSLESKRRRRTRSAKRSPTIPSRVMYVAVNMAWAA